MDDKPLDYKHFFWLVSEFFRYTDLYLQTHDPIYRERSLERNTVIRHELQKVKTLAQQAGKLNAQGLPEGMAEELQAIIGNALPSQ